jgi:hypothetical protein
MCKGITVSNARARCYTLPLRKKCLGVKTLSGAMVHLINHKKRIYHPSHFRVFRHQKLRQRTGFANTLRHGIFSLVSSVFKQFEKKK